MNPSTRQRVAVITGASSGIGKEAAKALVKEGWTVICLGRDRFRCEQARAEILEQAACVDQVVMIRADLALLSDTARAAKEISGIADHVDVLLNNAGGLAKDLKITVEGNEYTFASNHLGPFLLTRLLLPLLKAAAACSPKGATRVINVSSAAHASCEGLDRNDVQMIRNFSSTPAYCRVKLANLLFTREAAKRLAADNIVVHAMHPGLVDSNFGSHGDDAMQSYLRARSDVSISPAVAADTLVWLACAEEPGKTTGGYYFERAVIPASAAARDDAAAGWLWEESENLVRAWVGQ
jgi:NAD(P)-dependent dehydrogenase (short-subunit alcohol dehydrogenase family)